MIKLEQYLMLDTEGPTDNRFIFKACVLLQVRVTQCHLCSRTGARGEV